MSISQINQNFSSISDAFNSAVELFKKQSTPVQVLVSVAALAAIGAVTALFVGLVNKIRNWNAEVVVIDPAKIEESKKTNDANQLINRQAQEISKVATARFDQLTANVANTSNTIQAREAAALSTIELKVVAPVAESAKEAADQIAKFAIASEDALTQLNNANVVANTETASSTEKAEAAAVVVKSSKVIADASEQINTIFEAFKAQQAEIEKDQTTLASVLKEKAHAESKSLYNIAKNNPVPTTIGVISAAALSLPFLPVALAGYFAASTVAAFGLGGAALVTSYNAVNQYNDTYVAPATIVKVETPVVPTVAATTVVTTEEKTVATEEKVPATKKAA